MKRRSRGVRQEAAADLGSPRRSWLSGKSRPLITEIIPHLRLDSFSSSASAAAAAVAAVFSARACLCVYYVCECAGGCGSSECGSVFTALSRIEELDFDHEAGDVTARSMRFS